MIFCGQLVDTEIDASIATSKTTHEHNPKSKSPSVVSINNIDNFNEVYIFRS